jgi:hypothetical protein
MTINPNATEVRGTCRIGYSGTATHGFVGERDEKGRVSGWALCGSGRKLARNPHSLKLDIPLNTETVTCNACRSFGCVEKL